MLQLTATPESALADEPLAIQVTGLPPSQVVTLKASLTDERGKLFLSRAFYRANEAGQVDLERDPSLGGDYVGIHPMGLFWSLKPQRDWGRLLKRDVMNSPFWVTLDLYDSICFSDLPTDKPKASLVVQRWFSRPGVERKQIREGRIRGVLFLPPGEGPFPGIIDLFGGLGGLVEFRASLLAARGFAVLALAYFAYEDLPNSLLEIDLEYFEEATNFLLAHPKIRRAGIGVISVSKGAEIGLAMACYLKQVVATICINGSNAVCDFPLKYRGLVVSPTLSAAERMQVHISGALCLRYIKGDPRKDVNPQSLLPVEKAQGWLLFIVGENDQCLESRVHAEQAMEQLKSHGKSNGRILLYPGAGHLIEPPFSPLCFASWLRSSSLVYLWGGDPAAHAAAQEHSWGEIQKFFWQHLTQTTSKL
ncbi:acyl-coenzyme A amino acid N-acyltransferase 2-like [Thomomys bottae]